VANQPSAQKSNLRGSNAKKHFARGTSVWRICADCGYKDSSPIPPAMCPMCHNNPESPLAPKNAMVAGNRKTRRKREAENRVLMRKVNKQLARERKDGPIVAG